MRRLLLLLWVAAVLALHQDVWLWRDRTLVFGFLPVGLAYHAAYCLLASLTMALLVRFMWPAELETAAREPAAGDAGGGEGRA